MNILIVILTSTLMSGLWELPEYNNFTLGIDIVKGKHIAILKVSTDDGNIYIPMKGKITNKGNKYKVYFISDSYIQGKGCLEKIEIKANGVLLGDFFSDFFNSLGMISFLKDCNGKKSFELNKMMGKWRRKNTGKGK